MAELTTRERRQPCLLDRLTDDESNVQQESRERRVISLAQLRKSVLRDLSWLLNTSARADAEAINDFPQVATSVLNFGIPDMCGLTVSSISAVDVERMVLEAIHRFEPRILRKSLTVRAVSDHEKMAGNAVAFEISGMLWAQPLPEQLYVKTEVDLETGQCTVAERPNG
jgi:type VI secretion system protein ImpF